MKLKIKLRKANINDLNFLFDVSTKAMLPVSQILDANKIIDENKKLQKYKAKFEPSKIQIIVMNGNDVGRLRTVNRVNEIYIGGIQILPKYQRLGIGTYILKILFEKAYKSNKSILLEVHKVNSRAIQFYQKLVFTIESETEKQFVMRKYFTK